jgi:putative DNA primase/helicase
VDANVPAHGGEREALLARQGFVRQAGRRWFLSAVARVYRPGCKADCAVILEGPQGAGKSSALAALVPDPEWFADDIADLGCKDSAQDLRGKWIIELGELSAMRRAEVERTKAFMSRAVDHYRPSYGRRSQDFPRQCVFAGTTNADAYLGDETGNRRFWPVKVGTIRLGALREVRDQLWGEAVAAFEAGEKWWLDAEVEAAAAEEQGERRIVDPWEERVLQHAVGRKEIGIDAALEELGVPVERRGQGEANRIARILRPTDGSVSSAAWGVRRYGATNRQRHQCHQ